MERQLASAVDLLRTLPPRILSSVVEGTGQSAEDLLRKLQGIESESAATLDAAAQETELAGVQPKSASAGATVDGEAAAEQTAEKAGETPAPGQETAA
jgi:hypothetical protein